MDLLNNIRLSAVIPCYREAQSIPVMHERLTAVFRELGVDYEIIFVDSGSPDDTPEVLAELAARDRRVTVVHHTRAFGSQSAYSSGMRLATGDAVILLDGDLQDPPELIPELVARWQEGYEVVYGERVTREGPALMNAARKAFYRVFQRTSYVAMPVDAGDFSLLDRTRRRRDQRAARDAPLRARPARVRRLSARSASPTSARSGCSGARRTTSSPTSAGRAARSSRSPTRRST